AANDQNMATPMGLGRWRERSTISTCLAGVPNSKPMKSKTKTTSLSGTGIDRRNSDRENRNDLPAMLRHQRRYNKAPVNRDRNIRNFRNQSEARRGIETLNQANIYAELSDN